MDRMREGHVGSFVILNLAPTGPLYGAAPDSPPFFSQAWWNILRGVLERARARGMRVWLYDQLGFSTARIQERLMERQPDWRAVELGVLEQEIVGPKQVEMRAPGRTVAACALRLDESGKPTGPPSHLSSSLTPTRLVKAMPEGRWRLMLFHERPGGFDYMSPTAAGRLLNYVHGEYERKLRPYLGKTIAGTFQDELPPMNRWTRRFLDEFRKRKGYDLRPWLSALWYDVGPRTPAIRCDVADVQAQLLEEAFFRPLYQWHQRHGMMCSYDQMTRDADPIEANRYYVDYMRTMRWFQVPGNDHHGLSRPHSSLAHLYARPRVWLEGFYNSGWGQTLEDLSARLHEFYAQGANLYNPHAWYYTTRGAWWEWAPPCTSFRQPYWQHYPLFADYVARLSFVLSQGSHVCDIAVLYPSSTVHADGTYVGKYGQATQRARDTYKAICSFLETTGIDYDVLDEASLQRAVVSGGRLRVASEAYRCIVLPSVTTLDLRAAEKLALMARSGGIVAAAGALPSASRQAGEGDGRLAALVKRMFGEGGQTAQDGSAVTVRPGALYSHSSAEALARAVVERLPSHAAGVSRAIHRRVGGRDLYALFHLSAGRTDVTLRGSGGATVLKPWTGQAVRTSTRDVGGGRVGLPLDFSESRVLFVMLDGAARPPALPSAGAKPSRPGAVFPAATKPAAKGTSSAPPSLTLANEWVSQLVPTLDNRWGDFSLPPSTAPMPVECRRFAYREEADGEDGVEEGWHLPDCPQTGWQTVTATFGTYWWITRPGMGEGSLRLPGPEDGDWRPDPEIWQPAKFSLRYGIERNPIYQEWLGPKGRVPDEYLDFGVAPPGTVRFAVTFLYVEQPCDVVIRCGAGDARIAVNSKWLPPERPLKARLLKGYNAIVLQVRHPSSGRLRTYVHVGPADGESEDPYWIWTGSQADVADCFARRTFHLDEVPRAAILSITADNGYEVYVNGTRVGRDVGVGTEVWSNAERYSVARLLRRGKNVLAVRAWNLGGPAGLVAILSWPESAAGETRQRWHRIATDGSWRVVAALPANVGQRWTTPAYDDSTWRRATVLGRYPCEPWGIVQGLRRAEPAILPESGWLNGETLPWVPGLIMDARPGLFKPTAWYRFRTPPGATSMRLSIAGKYAVYIEGRECLPDGDGTVRIPIDLQGPSLLAAVRVDQAAGHYEGAAFLEPLRFEVGNGTIRPGNWAEQGLPNYSGGVRYSQIVTVSESLATAPVVLDLGRVRGTAEVNVNGRSAGVRLWRPYRFDITGLLRPGQNTIAVTVYNTLGPYFGAASPSPYVLPGQETSGLFGPVRIITGQAAPPPRVSTVGLVNVALAELGATVRASSEHPSGLYLSDSVLAGYTTGERWARGGGWNDGTEGAFPDWLEINLHAPRTVRAVRIITLEPAAVYGIRDVEVYARRGKEWVRCADVRDNEDVTITVPVPGLRTDAVRIVVNASNDDAFTRIIAVHVLAEPGDGSN